MKVQWEEADVVCGRQFGKPGISERQIIGFVPGMPDPTMATISLADGQVSLIGSRVELAAFLTKFEYLPVELLD